MHEIYAEMFSTRLTKQITASQNQVGRAACQHRSTSTSRGLMLA